MVARMQAHIAAHGFGFWAVETRERGELAGMTGLVRVKDVMPFAPAVEVGWRLAREHWGRGYATEGARAALEYGFGELGLAQIVSITARSNEPSRRVMQRIGMQPAGTFEHPSLEPGSALRTHWLYRASPARVAFACGTFRAEEIAPAQLPQLQRFFEANPAYFTLVEGQVPGPDYAREELDALPPAGWPFTRHYLIAFRARDGGIVAVADVLSDLFSEGVWHVGLFLAAERLHGSGVPHALYAHLEAWMRSNGARWLRLGVVRGNLRGARFWEKMGYVDVAQRRDYEQGVKRHTLRVMAKALAGGSLDEYRALVPRDRESTAAIAQP
jgi:RimJ/RimL family protein N-acetyltransferase